MLLREQLSADLKSAMKAKEADKVSVLRMVTSAMKNASIDSKRDLEDNDVVAIIQKELKQRRESLEQFEQAGRDELAATERASISLLEAYLPEQLSEDKVVEMITSIIQEVGAESPADMGKVMGKLMPQIAGQFDGGRAQKIVQQTLSS